MEEKWKREKWKRAVLLFSRATASKVECTGARSGNAMTFGERVRDVRKSKGMTLKFRVLAELSDKERKKLVATIDASKTVKT